MLTKSGQKIVRLTGVRSIMNDIQSSSRNHNRIINLGAGNPVLMEHLSAFWLRCYDDLRAEKERLINIIGRYGDTQGSDYLINELCYAFNEEYSQNYEAKNTIISTGSQSIFFAAANLFVGEKEDGTHQRLLLPNLPDYTGYSGVCLSSIPLSGVLPKIKSSENELFRYELDFKAIKEAQEKGIGAAFISSPTNPTGKVIKRHEFEALKSTLKDTPLFIDNAYGKPFPNLNYSDDELFFSDKVVNTFSFSKAGLPGGRVGFAMGDQAIISDLKAFQANSYIHSCFLAQGIAEMAIRRNSEFKEVLEASKAYYYNMYIFARHLFKYYFSDIDYQLHEVEGGMFIWAWFPSSNLDDVTIYERAKKHGVFFVPGRFFFGGEESFFTNRCLRISLTCSEEELEIGLKVLAKVLAEQE